MRMKNRPSSSSPSTSVAVVCRTSVMTTSPVPDRLMSYDGCCAPPLVSTVRPSVSLNANWYASFSVTLPSPDDVRGAAEAGDQEVREVRRVDAIGFLRRLALGARRQERVAAHVGRFVHEERRPLPAALDARERAGRTGVEHGDADVGRNLIEPIAQRAIRVAIVAEQQALLVGVARVVDDDLGAPRRRAAAVVHARA